MGDVVFLGATLWTDFALNGNPVVSEVVAQTSMNDYRRIRTLPRYSRLKPSDTRRLHMESRRWLEDQAFAHKGRKVVIVTHHAPSRESIPPAFAGDTCNPAFASDMSRFIVESEAQLVGPWPYPLLLRLHAGQNTRSSQPTGLSDGVPSGF